MVRVPSSLVWLILVLIVALVVPAVSQNRPLPKPQVGDAEGNAAPDFTLKDQDGKEFRLASHRGERLLLYFYRGYW